MGSGSSIDVIRSYAQKEWATVPVPRGKKAPVLLQWQMLRLGPQDISDYFGEGDNVGVLLGEPSSGLVDVDLDAEEARSLAEAILPPTQAVFGREGSPHSHWLFSVQPPAKTKKFQDPDGTMLLELRSTGMHTVFPPSVHPSGEAIRWEAEGSPAEYDETTLREACGRLATAALLARHWPAKGSRQDATLALAGALLRGEWTLENTKDFILRVVETARDEEAGKRMGAVEDTAETLARGDPATGWPRLTEYFDDRVARRAREWLALDTARGEEHLSDLGNAKRLVSRHRDDLRYCQALKRWLWWDGRCWKLDETGEVMRRAKETVRSIYGEAVVTADSEARKQVAKHAHQSERGPRIREMIALAESEEGIPVVPEQLDRDPWLLNCQNGTVDLRTGELGSHRRGDLITKLAPVSYDPTATSVLWETFLHLVLPDADTRAFVQRAVGYSILGLPREECLFFIYGREATGKGTFLAAVGAALGSYAATADFETFLKRSHVTGSPRNDIARLAGARFVVSQEVDEGRHLAEGLIKTITGGDVVTSRFLYKEAFEFTPTFTLWLAANHQPRLSGEDGALWRRIHQVPFDVSIPEAERDPKVKETLRDAKASGAAIVAWAVQGRKDYLSGGLRVPAPIREATEQYRASVDIVGTFIEECCVVGDSHEEFAQALYASYGRFCNEAREQPSSQKSFGEALSRRGFRKRKSTRGRSRWWGIRLVGGDLSDPK